jgi:hypothetical protein
MARTFAIILAAGLISTGQSNSEEKCVPRNGYFDLHPGQQFAGMFRIALDPPNFRDLASVQSHFVYSTTWAHVIGIELSNSTKGLCGARVTPYGFPDLRVFLMVFRSTQQVEREKSICTLALQDILLHSRPSDDALKQAAMSSTLALQHAQPSERPDGEILDQSNILQAALPHIYERNSLLHALASMDALTYQSLDAQSFYSWLREQRSSNRIEFLPISHCLPAADGSRSTTVGEFGRLRRHSGIMSPGAIHISRAMGGAVRFGPLRYLVIVGNADGPRSPLSTSEVTEKYCNRAHSFSVGDGSPSVVSVRIRCQSTSVYDLDSWTVLYCDPKDCVSDLIERVVLATIASDPDVLVHTRRSSDDATPRGPYLVTVTND